jgi:hypothetical protein
MKQNFKALSLLCGLIAIIYFLFKVFFIQNQIDTKNFAYSLESLFLFFAIFAMVIAFVLSIIREKNLDIVGYVFLILTSVQMGTSFFFGRPIIKNQSPQILTEKWIFFSLFIVFLVLETLYTVWLLNKKD